MTEPHGTAPVRQDCYLLSSSYVASASYLPYLYRNAGCAQRDGTSPIFRFPMMMGSYRTKQNNKTSEKKFLTACRSVNSCSSCARSTAVGRIASDSLLCSSFPRLFQLLCLTYLHRIRHPEEFWYKEQETREVDLSQYDSVKMSR